MKKIILALMAVMMMAVLCGCISTNTGEVDPDEVKMSITGIDEDEFFVPMGLDSIDVLKDGQAVLHANGDLLDSVGENYVAAMGVSEAYVLPYGNGGYRIVIFVLENGSVSLLNPVTMIEKHAASLKNNIGKLEDIVSVEQGEDFLIYAVNKDGKKIILDDYFRF